MATISVQIRQRTPSLRRSAGHQDHSSVTGSEPRTETPFSPKCLPDECDFPSGGECLLGRGASTVVRPTRGGPRAPCQGRVTVSLRGIHSDRPQTLDQSVRRVDPRAFR